MNGRKAREQERKNKRWPRSIERYYGEINLSSILYLSTLKTEIHAPRTKIDL